MIENDKAIGYFTLEDKYLLADLNEHPKNIFNYITQAADNKDKLFLLIDEIQYLEDPSNFLKYVYDLYKDKIKLVVTGSSAFYIDQKYKDSLAGRKKIIQITPLTFSEFLTAKGEAVIAEKIKNFSILENNLKKNDKLLKPDMDIITLYYREYFRYGGYPRVVLQNDISDKTDTLKELYQSFLRKDVFESGIRNELKFFELLRLIADQAGELLNVNEISNTLNISREAVQNYVYVLEKGFIIKLIRPFHTNIRKELGKMPKVFFLDTGYRNTILNNYDDIELRSDKGQSLENSFFTCLNNHNAIEDIRFWRTKDKNEVDFIIKEKNAFEIKFNKNNFNPKKYESFTGLYPKIPLNCVSFTKNYRSEDEIAIFDFLR